MNSHANDKLTDTVFEEVTVRRMRTEEANIAPLRAELFRKASQESGLVEVSYSTIDSAIGRLLLAATAEGLAYIGFECEGEAAMLDLLAARLGSRILRCESGTLAGPAAVVDETAAQVESYLAGRRRDFELPLDTRLVTGFRGDVQRHLPTLGYGHTATYKELAASLGRPSAVRAVGTACARNPLPLVWPCHRVLRSDGGLGGYRGGLEAKRFLLDLEDAL